MFIQNIVLYLQSKPNENMSTTQVQINTNVLNIITNLQAAVEKSPTGVSFLSIKNYESGKNDKKCIVAKIADYVINIGASYENAKNKDIAMLQALDVTNAKYAFKSDVVTLELAKVELINSFITPNENRSNGQIDAYTRISNGLKVHNETGLLYVYGYKLSQKVSQAGEYIPTKSSDKTIAKNELRKLLRTGKFTQYSLAIGNEIKTNGTTIEL